MSGLVSGWGIMSLPSFTNHPKDYQNQKASNGRAGEAQQNPPFQPNPNQETSSP